MLGPGRYVNRLMNGDLYLQAGVVAKLKVRHDGFERVRVAISAVPGVAAAYFGDELDRGEYNDKPFVRQFRNSYVPSRSGDILVLFKPYWLVGGTGGTSHASPYRYDTHVPIVLMGPGIGAGEHAQPSSPLDIAPTLAYLAGITLPNAQGRVLTEALSSSGDLAARRRVSDPNR